MNTVVWSDTEGSGCFTVKQPLSNAGLVTERGDFDCAVIEVLSSTGTTTSGEGSEARVVG